MLTPSVRSRLTPPAPIHDLLIKSNKLRTKNSNLDVYRPSLTPEPYSGSYNIATSGIKSIKALSTQRKQQKE